MANLIQTPIMKQWEEMKKKHPDAVLLFRIGDFYECFKEDAIFASEILCITLTRRADGKTDYIELAGFPHHALDIYLPKLVRAGKRVAICEQLVNPKAPKSISQPEVTELVSPAIPKLPEHKQMKTSYFSILFSILSAFQDIINILYIFEEIRSKTRDIRILAGKIGLSPLKAFEECSVSHQPSLFE